MNRLKQMQFSDNPRMAFRRAATGLVLLTLMLMGIGSSLWAAERSANSHRYRDRLEQLRKDRKSDAAVGARIPKKSERFGERKEYIDTLLAEEWSAQELPLAKPATEGEFLRRVTLDLIGRIPTLEETEAFLADRSSDKREQLVERLLASDEFGKHLANSWTKLLLEDVQEQVRSESLHAWLEANFNRNTPWNETVRELLTAQGSWEESPATNFLIGNFVGGSTVPATSKITKIFLCVQTQCTECHDHPWNDWKQEQFHGMNGFFLGTRKREDRRVDLDGRQFSVWYLEELPIQELSRDRQLASYERRNGTVGVTFPTYLDGRSIFEILRGAAGLATSASANGKNSGKRADPLPATTADLPKEPVYLRNRLADVVTSEENPYFSRAIVNRMWFHFFGNSFIRNVDDFDNGLDEPTMPELLDQLAADFVASGHDLKALCRWLVLSQAYSLGSKVPARGSDEESLAFFHVMTAKPLSPEQLYDSVIALTAFDKTSKSAESTGDRQRFVRDFINSFGTGRIPTARPQYDGTITQALMLMNSPLMAEATQCRPGNLLHRLISAKMSDAERVEKIYLAAFSRRPTSAERTLALGLIKQAPGLHEGLEDVLWVVLNSPEFMINY